MPNAEDERQNRKEALKMATDSHRKTQTHLSPFVACRLYDDFDLRYASDTLVKWGVVCCDENAFTFS